MSSEWLDKRIQLRRKPGDVGIELEIEGALNFGPHLPTYWTAKEEGSLRGGWEFVLKKPIPMSNLAEALEHLRETLDQSSLSPSIRCSTHIHVNVSHLTNRQVYQALGYYFLIEDLLVRTQGPLRTGNLFCLRMSDAESVAHELVRSVRDGGGFNVFNMDSHKYGAVNLAAVRKFGSLEFRFLRPLDTAGISFWTKLLHRMVNTAADLPLPKVLGMLENQKYREILELCLTPDEIGKVLPTDIPWQYLLEINADYVDGLSQELNRRRKLRLPREFAEDDIDRDEGWAYAAPQWNPFPTAPEGLVTVDGIDEEDDFDFDYDPDPDPVMDDDSDLD